MSTFMKIFVGIGMVTIVILLAIVLYKGLPASL